MVKTVLITGASRGIGRAAATAFAKDGWRVAAVYEKNHEKAKELEKETGCRIYQCDVSDLNAVNALKIQTDRDFGCIGALVNNAGVSLSGIFQTHNQEDIRHMYGVNLFGTLNMTRVYLADMINRKSGAVVNVSSVFGIHGGSCEVDYSASKAAVIGFTKALAREAGPSGIRVNCVAPGVIDTDMNSHLTVNDVRELVEAIPLESLGRPENIAEAILFLASDKAAYITGAVLNVDGGMGA